jgi:hypothetical protein
MVKLLLSCTHDNQANIGLQQRPLVHRCHAVADKDAASCDSLGGPRETRPSQILQRMSG